METDAGHNRVLCAIVGAIARPNATFRTISHDPDRYFASSVAIFAAVCLVSALPLPNAWFESDDGALRGFDGGVGTYARSFISAVLQNFLTTAVIFWVGSRYGGNRKFCIVTKLCPPQIRRTLREFIRLHYPRRLMPVKLDDDKIKYVIREKEKEKGTLNATIAESMKISSRHVRRLWAKYRSTGSLPTISSGGRPATKTISDEEVEMVLAECRRGCSGVGRVTKALADKNISGRTVYNIMKKHGLVESCPAKAKKRKWVRFERQYSNAMWHTDWHVMKDFRVRDLNLITYLDDASRCVTGYGVFKEATGLNAVEVLRQAILAFGTPASILSDNGSCFVGVRSGTPKGTWTPTIFESELLDRGIQLINSRPYHPQTNGKLERFHRTLETEVGRHDSLDDFVTYYNERRLHWSLDIDNHQTPLKAFHDKATYETIRVDNPNWMEVDIHG